MDKPKNDKPKAIEVIEQAGGVVNVYANTVHLDWTLYDLRIRFGQLMYAGDPALSKMTVEERTAVTITWAEAKYLRDSLSEVIARYERVNGELQQPKLAPSSD